MRRFLWNSYLAALQVVGGLEGVDEDTPPDWFTDAVDARRSQLPTGGRQMKVGACRRQFGGRGQVRVAVVGLRWDGTARLIRTLAEAGHHVTALHEGAKDDSPIPEERLAEL